MVATETIKPTKPKIFAFYRKKIFANLCFRAIKNEKKINFILPTFIPFLALFFV